MDASWKHLGVLIDLRQVGSGCVSEVQARQYERGKESGRGVVSALRGAGFVLNLNLSTALGPSDRNQLPMFTNSKNK